MIRRIQALSYRCFRHIDVSLDRFHVLVGPNASGKSTLFDVVSFLGDMMRDGLRAAIDRRTRNFQDLAWGRPGVDPRFELAVEMTIPELVRRRLPKGPIGEDFQAFRYEVAIEERGGEVSVARERGLLVGDPARPTRRRSLRFPENSKVPATITNGGGKRGSRTVFSQDRQGERVFRPETTPRARKSPVTGIPFGSSGLAASPGNISSALYPAASHVIYMLAGFGDRVVLDGSRLRSASPRDSDRAFTRDGASLPWNVQYLQEIQEDDYREWIRHVQTVLPELEGVRVVDREDDRHAYLMLRYANGTLKLLALTLLAYLPGRGAGRRRSSAGARCHLRLAGLGSWRSGSRDHSFADASGAGRTGRGSLLCQDGRRRHRHRPRNGAPPSEGLARDRGHEPSLRHGRDRVIVAFK